MPVLLIGDHRLGGIATTISAWESLHVRGYDVLGLLVFRDRIYQNSEYLSDYFKPRNVLVGTIEQPPPMSADRALDDFCMRTYYDNLKTDAPFNDFTQRFANQLVSRNEALKKLPSRTDKVIWHPFLQHTERSPSNILAIDSAYGDYFQALKPQEDRQSKHDSMLEPAFDGSASWWTQGLGHGNPDLALTAAYAAGRYGHVMFANAAHEPAVQLAERLLDIPRDSTSTQKEGRSLAKPSISQLSKVFYTDNGSTGMEVAVKMALKASAKRYGWEPSDDIKILGLEGSYHGDTIGVMDCSEGNVYNAKVEWYKGRGHWFKFPTVKMVRGKWMVVPPSGLEDIFGTDTQQFDRLEDIFDLGSREKTRQHYRDIIDPILQNLVSHGNKFGALIMEPVILGAGGMMLADPLFQNELWQATQRLDQGPIEDVAGLNADNEDWRGMPLVTDEVFTGMYRLGQPSSSKMINVRPDVSVFAKLLTGGLLPLAATVATESIFNSFLSEEKADALLHGHSYTAHAMGCSVALDSLDRYKKLDASHGSWAVFKKEWRKPHNPEVSISDTSDQDSIWSVWPSQFVADLSFQPNVEGVFALGTVLAVEMKDSEGAGYTSKASIGVRDRLLEGRSELNQSIHCRVLGNILYFMASLTSTPETLETVATQIRTALDQSSGGA